MSQTLRAWLVINRMQPRVLHVERKDLVLGFRPIAAEQWGGPKRLDAWLEMFQSFPSFS